MVRNQRALHQVVSRSNPKQMARAWPPQIQLYFGDGEKHVSFGIKERRMQIRAGVMSGTGWSRGTSQTKERLVKRSL